MPGADWCGAAHTEHQSTGIAKVRPELGVQCRLLLCIAACRTSRRTCSRSQEPGSNPHRVCARNIDMGEFRGFHHRGLCDTCPQAGSDRRVGSRSGQVSHNHKHKRPFDTPLSIDSFFKQRVSLEMKVFRDPLPPELPPFEVNLQQ